MTNDVLIVDDDDSIRKTVASGLQVRNFSVIATANGSDALDVIKQEQTKVVVLDLGLPDVDGIDLVRSIRSFSRVPIIVLSADGSDSRKVLALELGADDYVTKPFSIAELVARVRVALRHRAEDPVHKSAITIGRLQIDSYEHACHIDGHRIELTPKEFAMLASLASRPGSLVTHRALLREVWGEDYLQESHYLRVYASHIRKKIGEGPGIPEIRVEAGVGYRLIATHQ